MTARSTTPSPPRRGARDKALTAALELFNEHGTAAVSTNHIAQRAGISPGNLYYWFTGKSAIIAALFEQWSQQSAPTVPADASPGALLVALFSTAEQNEARAYSYRGIARELLPLLHSDPDLHARYVTNYRARTTMLSSLAASLVDAGLLRAPDAPDTIEDLVVAAWVLDEFAPPFLHELEHERLPGSRLGSTPLLRAYLTDEGRRVLAAATTTSSAPRDESNR